jgi:hypothetical protein
MTYKSFTTPRVLFDKLIQRYQGPVGKSVNATELQKTKFRVCVVLNQWIDNAYSDFYPELAADLHQFIDSIAEEGTDMQEMSKRVKSTLQKRKEEAQSSAISEEYLKSVTTVSTLSLSSSL